MKMISPSNREVDIKLDPLDTTTTRTSACAAARHDAYLRNRAADLGTTLVNGLVQKIDTGGNRGALTPSITPITAAVAPPESRRAWMWI